MTYDPSGTPSVSGSANGWPFLYHGMEQESIDPTQFYYSGSGAYYSAQIMRSMSMTSAQGRKGPSGDASGIVGGDGMALSGGINAAAIAERAAYLDAPTEGFLNFTYNNGDSSYSVPVPSAWFMAGWDFVFFLNDILGGSNGGSGPTYRQQLMELRATQGGRHPIYTAINGISNTLIVDQRDPAPAAQAPGRGPDYRTLEINYGEIAGPSLDFTVDRYGHAYFGVGAQAGLSWWGYGGSFTGGYLDQSSKPSEAQLHRFLTGNSFDFSAGLGGGITGQWTPGVNRAVALGFYTPQFGFSWHYTWGLN